MQQEIVRFSLADLKINIRSLNIIQSASYTGLHFHKEIEIVRADCGDIGCYADGDEFVLAQGKMLFVNRDVFHRLYYVGANARCTYMQINLENYIPRHSTQANEYLSMFLSGKNVKPYGVFDEGSELSNVFDSIFNEDQKQKAYYKEYIQANTHLLCAFMLRFGFLNSDSNSQSTAMAQKIIPAVHYVEQNYSNKVYLEQAANTMNMDKYYFCKLFKSVTGAPFVDYVNFVRLSKAVELLIETNNNISEIAFDCGFSSVQYFNRIFKAGKGCTPKEYRKMLYRIV